MEELRETLGWWRDEAGARDPGAHKASATTRGLVWGIKRGSYERNATSTGLIEASASRLPSYVFTKRHICADKGDCRP